jgi:hypothetical protein
MLGKCDNCGLENVEARLINLDSQNKRNYAINVGLPREHMVIDR